MLNEKINQYIKYYFLKMSYDHIYTHPILNYLKKMIISLLIEIIIVSIIKIYYPHFMRFTYAFYNYFNICKIMNLVFKFVKEKRLLNIIMGILLIRIFINNYYMDIILFLLTFLYLFPRREKISFIGSN